MPVGPKHGDRVGLVSAVESLLAQSFRDFELVIVADGGDKLPGLPADDRLHVITLSENHGRYYCDSLVLSECTSTYWGPHDSDDWSGLRRYELLMRKAAEGFEAVWSDRVVYRSNGSTKVIKAAPKPGELAGTHAHHAGIYAVDALRHGPHPDFRCSWDSVFVSLALLYMRWAVCTDYQARYHHVRRDDSLTASPETKDGSDYRHDVRERYRALWQRCKDTPPERWNEFLHWRVSR